MAQLTVSELYRELIATLAPSLGEREAKSAARVILEDVRGISPTDIIINGHRTVEDITANRVRRIADAVIDGEPVQYAVGSARFYGMDFLVSPAVLIPRPETEGLVDMIVKDYADRSDLKVLDCGTGSGCIAIALARNLAFADVDAIDISDAAIEVANVNAKVLKTSVKVYKRDIMTLKPDNERYDIIVSNPPYISETEAAEMDKRVKDHEPRTALFVPDDNPLQFYRPIAEYASVALKSGGALYFEINPRFVDEMKSMLAQSGFNNIDTQRDYIGRYRYIKASK
ncbi:MAG: peptide chain release factor N(5)-glutamine methyltransferase [Muribaculaceae bacterium]|nr:peptide chain release factor N(5)-glutamine methyltransferase [Muribaculaceae bacterium]